MTSQWEVNFQLSNLSNLNLLYDGTAHTWERSTDITLLDSMRNYSYICIVFTDSRVISLDSIPESSPYIRDLIVNIIPVALFFIRENNINPYVSLPVQQGESSQIIHLAARSDASRLIMGSTTLPNLKYYKIYGIV